MLRINVKFGTKRVGWLFHYDHDAHIQTAFILPWAIPDYQVLAEDSPVDFLVIVYPPGVPEPNALPPEFLDFAGMKFIISGEPLHRFPNLDHCYSIVNNPQDSDHAGCRYGPTMCFWVPPLSIANKTRFCSVIESGRHPWRVEMIRSFMQGIGPIDLFGRGTSAPLSGYHLADAESIFGNAKCRGIQNQAYYLSLESYAFPDYWTEKIGDAIMCEAVPVYFGCPNIYDYFIPESIIAWADVPRFAWPNWRAEYELKRKYVLMQKELLRTKFNMFSFIRLLIDEPGRLERKRPITR